jgi:hypothetical protein
MHLPNVNEELKVKGDPELIKIERRLAKYLERMYEIVRCKDPKFLPIGEEGIFREID